MKIRKVLVLLIAIALGISTTACGNSKANVIVTEAETEVIETEAVEAVTEEETGVYYDDVPELYEGCSEFVGPWAYMMYAMDESTSYVCHEAYDGYVPKAGDLLITGEEWDYWYFDESSFYDATGLRYFPYGSPDYIWNGHILYIADVSEDGVLTCYEGNTIAPGQDLDEDDEDYIYLSSIDQVEIDYYTSETLTADKVDEKPIRIVIETGFSPSFVQCINETAQDILEDFEKNPSDVRRSVMDLYPSDIDWCGLFVHYLLLSSADSFNK